MRTRMLFISLIACSLLLAFALTGCSKKEVKKGRVAIKNYQYVVRQDTPHVFAVDAVGTVQNVGDCDVKHIVIVGVCTSCQKKWIEGKWFTSDVPPSKDEEGTVGYLSKGSTAKFRVKDIAMMMHKDNATKPSNLPDKMELKILSFEAVQ